LQRYPRELNTYSKFMSVDLKEANKMHYRVKGHLIPDGWSDSDIVSMYDSYFKRMWGNNEGQSSADQFEKVWQNKLLQVEETEQAAMETVCRKGYD